MGYRIERLSRFRTEIDALLRRGSTLKFVQIGANDGVRFDDLYQVVTNARCSGLVVEPLPDMYQRLQQNYRDYPAIVPINVAIHEHVQAVPLYRLHADAVDRYAGWATGIASFDRDHLIRHGIDARDVVAVEVPCEPLMLLLQRTGMLDADLMQVDTEGYDAQIIGMIDFKAFLPSLIKFEHKNMSREVRAATLELLRRNGYRCTSEGADTVAWR